MDLISVAKFLENNSLTDAYKLYVRDFYESKVQRNALTTDKNVYKENLTHIYYISRNNADIRVVCINKKTNKLDSYNDNPCIFSYEEEDYKLYEKVWAKNGIVHRSGNFPAVEYFNGRVIREYYRNGHIWKIDKYHGEQYVISNPGYGHSLIHHNLLGLADYDICRKPNYIIYGRCYAKKKYDIIVKSARKIYLRNRAKIWLHSFITEYVYNPNTEYGKKYIESTFNEINEFQNSVFPKIQSNNGDS